MSTAATYTSPLEYLAAVIAAVRSQAGEIIPDRRGDVVVRDRCPVCEPGPDAPGDLVNETFCALRQPTHAGLDDAKVDVGFAPSGTAECEGRTNAAWCEVLHHHGVHVSRGGLPPASTCREDQP